jgi:hypothetical protein
MTLAEYQLASSDNLSFKYNSESVTGSSPDITNYPLNTYVLRRDKTNQGRAIIIGDVPKEDVFLYVALNTNSIVSTFGDDLANYPANGNRFKPLEWFGFGVRKSEDENYKITYKGTFLKLADWGTAARGAAYNKPVAIPTWQENSAEGDQDFPITTKYTKKNYYSLKTKDPYKKQKFICPHINAFDVDQLRTSLCQAFFGVTPKTSYLSKGTVTDVESPIVTSAVGEEKDPWDGTKKTEEEQPTSAVEEQPTSAKPAEIDKAQKKVNQDEKQLKQEKQKLQKLKAQPTSAMENPGEDYKKKLDEASS